MRSLVVEKAVPEDSYAAAKSVGVAPQYDHQPVAEPEGACGVPCAERHGAYADSLLLRMTQLYTG